MPVEIRVPPLGESVVEATVGRWLKHEGDAIAPGEALVELETDKVNMEVNADAPGVLQRILHPEGDTVGVNEVLAVLAEAGAVPQPERPAAPVAAAAPAAPVEQGNGRPAPAASPVARQMAADKGIDLAEVSGSGVGGKITKEDVESYLHRNAQVGTAERGLTKPAVESPQERTVAVPPAERPTERPAAAPPPAQPAPATARAERPAAPSSLPVTEQRPEERVRMSPLRRTIAQRLVEAQHTAAMLTTFNEVDMSAVMEVRKRRRDSFKERHGVGLGFMSFFTKATVGALKAFPRLNAEIQGEDMVLKYYYDIGIAVSTEAGLVVPVVRDADRKTFAEIEREIADLAARARDRKLSLPELMGGTFTITNGGVFGSLLSTPILNAPQVGILGMHKIEERPVAVNGQVVIKPMMYLALSYDHRIVDGSEAVRFLVRVKELIEDPETLLLEG